MTDCILIQSSIEKSTQSQEDFEFIIRFNDDRGGGPAAEVMKKIQKNYGFETTGTLIVAADSSRFRYVTKTKKFIGFTTHATVGKLNNLKKRRDKNFLGMVSLSDPYLFSIDFESIVLTVTDYINC